MGFRLFLLFSLCFLFAPFVAAQSSIRERTERFLETHPDKAEARRVVQYGLARLSNFSLCRENIDDSSYDASFFAAALSRLKNNTDGTAKALAFIKKGFHRPAKWEIAANVAVPNLWCNKNPFGTLQCGEPSQPFSLSSVLQTEETAATVPTVSVLKRWLALLTAEERLTVDEHFSLYRFHLVSVKASHPVQRLLPLLI